MNCERIQEKFLDLQDNRLPAAEADEVRAHLQTCPVCQREWASLQEISERLAGLPPIAVPSARLRTQFDGMLAEHRREAGSRSPFGPTGWLDRFFAALLPARPAVQFAFACILLAAGVFLGARLLNRPAPVVADATTARELTELRKQVDTLGQLVGYSVIQQQSTSERLKAVFATLDRQQPDQRAVGDLLGALAFDPSTNVRLSALEALFPLANQAVVRTAVAASLPRDPSPLVQVAMIDFLASTRDPAATSAIEKVTRGDTYDKSVRDAARQALSRM